jgi:dTMP kinase
LRGRIFSFVLSSVRIMLLLTIATGPVLAGRLGSHAVPVGNNAHLRFSGPGLTLLLGGVVALLVSYYATSRATRSRTRLRDILRRRVMSRGMGRLRERTGLFVTVEGVDAEATAAWVRLLVAELRRHELVASATAEPIDSPLADRTEESVEPETAALLSAADRTEHVAGTIRPALERGEVVVCDRYVTTSLAVHGGGRGADVDRIRQVNGWSTGDLLPDLSLVVANVEGLSVAGLDDAELAGVRATLLEAVDADPDRCFLCPDAVPEVLPADVVQRLRRLIDARGSVLTTAAATEHSRTAS